MMEPLLKIGLATDVTTAAERESARSLARVQWGPAAVTVEANCS